MNWTKINQARINYLATFATKLDFHTVSCNIDECWINRNTHPNYSWCLRIKIIEWNNISLVGRINWIMAIFSKGTWMDLTLWVQFTPSYSFSFWLFFAIGLKSQTCFQRKRFWWFWTTDLPTDHTEYRNLWQAVETNFALYHHILPIWHQWKWFLEL